MKKYLKTNGSVGEQMIESVLLENDFNYSREYSFKNRLGKNQRMDFRIVHNNTVYCVEYHGEQHYKDKKWFNDSLELIQFRDKLKKEYCKDNDIIYIEIPYYNNTLTKVYNSLEEVFGNLKKPDYFIIEKGVEVNTKELLNYYSKHTKEETAKKYGVEKYHIDNLLTNLEYDSKREPKYVIEVYKRDNKVFEGTYNEIKENFDFTMSNVLKCLNGDMDKTSQHSFKYKDKNKDKERLYKVKNRKKLRGTRRGSSNKDVVLMNILDGTETTYSSVKECHDKTGLIKDKLYKLFNPNKNTNLVENFIGRNYDGSYTISREEALEKYYK